MIIGIGTDIIEVDRIKKACSKQAFLMRCFTTQELEYIKENEQRAASNFAVKESVAKSLGTGFRGFELIDIEVLRDELGKPYVNLYGNAKLKAEELNIDIFHVSISNVKEYAIAYVIAESR